MMDRTFFAGFRKDNKVVTAMEAAGYSFTFEPHKPKARTGGIRVTGPGIDTLNNWLGADRFFGFLEGWGNARGVAMYEDAEPERTGLEPEVSK